MIQLAFQIFGFAFICALFYSAASDYSRAKNAVYRRHF